MQSWWGHIQAYAHLCGWEMCPKLLLKEPKGSVQGRGQGSPPVVWQVCPDRLVQHPPLIDV